MLTFITKGIWIKKQGIFLQRDIPCSINYYIKNNKKTKDYTYKLYLIYYD